ncbi:MAG: nucleotidyltransferase domain-containing protein [Spirochaetales bacterium]|jgi:predicted nucleotidyltransferase|nr:nucleotidyltransferase domain-containing protein [Spirochaetales bacterium]
MDAAVQTEIDMLTNIIVQTIPVEQIYLFGSYAYGTPHKDSDLDLYVVMKDEVQMRNVEAGLKIRFAIDSQKTMPVDVLVSKKREYLQNKDGPTLEHKIAREGRLIYG